LQRLQSLGAATARQARPALLRVWRQRIIVILVFLHRLLRLILLAIPNIKKRRRRRMLFVADGRGGG